MTESAHRYTTTGVDTGAASDRARAARRVRQQDADPARRAPGAADPRARVLRERPRPRRRPRPGRLDGRRRHEAPRRRDDGPLRHGRHRLRRDERQRPHLRRRRADRHARLRRGRQGPTQACSRRSGRDCCSRARSAASRSRAARPRWCGEMLKGGRAGPRASISSGRRSGSSRSIARCSARTSTPGDVVIGVASTGLHSNGFSLARKVLLSGGASVQDVRARVQAHDRRGDARAHGALRLARGRAVRAQGARPRALPHHRRRLHEPRPRRGKGRLRARRLPRVARRLLGDRREGRRSRRPRCTPCSTWGSGSA